MNKTLFKEPILKEATFEFHFEPLFTIEQLAPDFAKDFSSSFEQGFKFTKVADNAPMIIPRFILSSKNKKVLEVSLSHVAFKANYETLELSRSRVMFNEMTGQIFNYLGNKKFAFGNFRASCALNYQLYDMAHEINNTTFHQLLHHSALRSV